MNNTRDPGPSGHPPMPRQIVRPKPLIRPVLTVLVANASAAAAGVMGVPTEWRTVRFSLTEEQSKALGIQSHESIGQIVLEVPR